MLEHFEKVNVFLNRNPIFTKFYKSRLIHIIRCGVLTIVLGATAISAPGECSSPIQVFLEGLFGIYLAGLACNLFVGCTLCVNNNLTDALYKKTCTSLVKNIEVCYIPVNWGFIVVEFIWYICGCVWYFEESDCNSEFSQGTQISVALIALWLAWYVVSAIVMLCFHCYVRSNVNLNEAQNQQNGQNQGDIPRIEVKSEGVTNAPATPVKTGYPTPLHTDPYSPNYSRFPEKPYNSEYPARSRGFEDSRFSGYPPHDAYSNPLSPDYTYNQYPDRNLRTDQQFYPPTYSESPSRPQQRGFDPNSVRNSPPRYDPQRPRDSFPSHPQDFDRRARDSFPSQPQDYDYRRESYPLHPEDSDFRRESYPSHPLEPQERIPRHREESNYPNEYYENPLAPFPPRGPSQYTR